MNIMNIGSAGLITSTANTAENSYRHQADTDFKTILRQAQEQKDDSKLREACQEIEAVFIHQMLQQMRATVPQSGFLEEKSAAKIYRDMLDEKYSELMARSNSNLGLADLLYRQLKREENVQAEDTK